MKSLVLCFGIAFASAGCTSSYTVITQIPTEISKLNESLQGKNVEIALVNGTKTEGENFRMYVDSAQWINSQSQNRICVSSDSVKTVIVQNPVLGGLEGLAIGLPLGFGASLVLVKILGSSNGGDTPSPLPAALAFGFGAAGGITAIYYGVKNGHTYIYDFHRIPESIRILSDSITQNTRIQHVVVQLVYPKKDIGIFGALISDSNVVILRVSRTCIWEIPSSSVRRIQPIQPDNFELSGCKDGWIVTRKDQSTVIGDSLITYRNGNLEMDYCDSKIVLSADEIQTLQGINKYSSLVRTINISTISHQGQEAILLNLVQQEHERKKRK